GVRQVSKHLRRIAYPRRSKPRTMLARNPERAPGPDDGPRWDYGRRRPAGARRLVMTISRLRSIAAAATVVFASIDARAQFELDRPVPFDSATTTGTFSNGLRYYIKVNHEPRQRAELRLAVRAGSILEDDDQRGIAHFVEHMGFNGTRDFK